MLGFKQTTSLHVFSLAVALFFKLRVLRLQNLPLLKPLKAAPLLFIITNPITSNSLQLQTFFN